MISVGCIYSENLGIKSFTSMLNQIGCFGLIDLTRKGDNILVTFPENKQLDELYLRIYDCCGHMNLILDLLSSGNDAGTWKKYHVSQLLREGGSVRIWSVHFNDFICSLRNVY